MKENRAPQLRNHTVEECEARLRQMREELFNLRFQRAAVADERRAVEAGGAQPIARRRSQPC